MSRFALFSTLSPKDVATTHVPVLLVAGLLLWITYLAIDPTPPKHIVLATGSKGSACERFAQTCRTVLARTGSMYRSARPPVRCRTCMDWRAARPDAAIAFIQSGTSNDEAPARSNLVSLAASSSNRCGSFRLVVPLSYANDLYSLKLHIDRVRSKLLSRPPDP